LDDHHAEDRTLAARAAQGDQEAFAALAERYRAYIYTIAYKISVNQEDALDIAQNVFVRVAENIGAFNGRGPFRSWLATIAAREAINHCRRPSRRETAMDPETVARLSESRSGGLKNNPRTEAEKAQQMELVESAMASLAPQQRAIFALRLCEDLGPKEIAERLGIPAQQARSQLHRAMATLRRKLGERE
jgi:RNA polymerase sigma-70 factor (ECF subfamily)